MTGITFQIGIMHVELGFPPSLKVNSEDEINISPTCVSDTLIHARNVKNPSLPSTKSSSAPLFRYPSLLSLRYDVKRTGQDKMRH